MITTNQIQDRINLSLEQKEEHALRTLRVFYSHHKVNGNIYVSFSGGKDSTVLLHLVRRQFPNTKAVYCDTGLEFPEIKDFVKTVDNVEIIRPRKSFKQVIQEYGFPFPSKEQANYIDEARNTKSQKLRDIRLSDGGNFCISKKWRFLLEADFNVSAKCCDVLKKVPFKQYEKSTGLLPIIGTKITDSRLRRQRYAVTGCNSFDNKITCRPLSIWTDVDIWNYIKKYNLPYSTIYDKGYDRTGCIFCLFGITQESTPNRIQRLQTTHPKLWNYVINELGYKEFLDFLNIPYRELTND